jgi:hypothetical protein
VTARRLSQLVQNVDGLLYKYYTAKEPDITGGVFIWKTREQTEAVYSAPD